MIWIPLSGGSPIRRLLGYLMRFALAAFGVALIATTAPQLPEAWQADRGGGTPGVFVAQRTSCGRRACRTYGTWISADGLVVYQGSQLGRRIPAGARVAAVAFPESGSERIYEPYRHNTVDQVVFVGAGLGTIVLAVYRIKPKSRRSPRPPTQDEW